MCLQAVTQTAVAPCDTIPPLPAHEGHAYARATELCNSNSSNRENLRDELNKFQPWLKSQDEKDFKVKQEAQHVRVLRKNVPFAYVLHPVRKEMGLANNVQPQP